MNGEHTSVGEKMEGAYRKELVLITRNAGVTASGFLFLNMISFISNALITRYLGADDYGLFVLATRVLDFIIVFSSLGFATTIVRHVAYFHAREDHGRVKGTVLYSLRVVLVVSFVVLALFFALGPFLFDRIFLQPEMGPLFRIILLSLPLSLIAMVYLSALNGLKHIKSTIIIRNFINPVVFTVLVGAVILFDWKLTGLMWVYVAAGLVTAFLAFNSLGKAYMKKLKDTRPEVEKKKLWNFSYPMLLIQVFTNITTLVPIFVIGYYMSSSDVGVFNVSLKIALIVSFSLNAFAMIFAPVMSELFSKKDHDMISRLYKTITKWTFSFSLVVFFIILLFPGTLLGIFGPEFVSGTEILLFIAGGELVNSGAGLVGSLILMSGRPKIILANNIFKFLLVVILCLILIPGYGLTGAAFAVALGQVSVNIIRLIELYHLEKMHPFKPSYYKPLLAGTAAYLIILLATGWLSMNAYLELMTGTILFLALFALLNWILKLDEEDKFVIDKLTHYFKRK
jgi:O-antigen/teichoic acid export membrane protein